MNIEVYAPKNIELKKYIKCFYVLNHSKTDETTSYFTFPSIFSIVSIISNVKINQTSTEVIIEESNTNNFISGLNAKFTKPLLVEYQGNIKEITTYFNPLGINAFLENPLNKYCHKQNSQFIPFSDYQKAMQKILEIDNNTNLLSELEKYWLEKLKEFKHHFLKKAVQSILINPETSISNIAQKNHISHKTLIEQFKKHICKTPTEFRKIVRFRKALKNNTNSLTELSYLANYFDQAHMIKDFKSLTGYTPRDFFNNLSSKQGIINWIYK